MKISNNILAAYQKGLTNQQEESLVFNEMIHNEQFAEMLMIMDEIDSSEEISQLEEAFYKMNDTHLKEKNDIDNINNTRMNVSKKFVVAPGVSAATPVFAHRLYEMYKDGRFDGLFHSNVAARADNTNDTEDIRISHSEVEGNIGFAQAETNYGKPDLNEEFNPNTYQYYPDTCAFQSQALILNEYGINVTQEDLIQIAKEQGWYVDGYGTPIDKVGKMLEYFGVDTSITEGNNIFNLVNELAQGHRVLVTVDSGELWNPGWKESLEDWISGKKADHALLVVGANTSDPDNIQIIVTDPGNGNTQYAYSEKQFLDAWKDSNCYMTSTNVSPEEFTAHQALPPMDTFADIPYASISRLSDAGLDISNSDYHPFLDDFLNHPDHLDTLITQYPALFDFSDDSIDVASNP